MIKKFLTCLALFISGIGVCLGQEDSLRQRIFLIGDAGDLVNGKHPVVDWLKKNVDWNDERHTAIFLGDNIYPYGLPSEGEPSFLYSKKILDYQISLVKDKKARAYFIMGNHDWRNGKIGGWDRSMNQVNYINGLLQSNIQALPQNGCPGPELIDLDTLVVLGLIDSQWFLHTHDKPGPNSNCAGKTVEEFTTELSEAVKSHQNQLFILAMHHPIRTVGVHGGTTYTLRHHLFPLSEAVRGLYIPLPVIGSAYPVARGLFGNIQDVNHPLYRTMANTIEEVIKQHPNPIVVSGHDHSLQLLQHDSLYQVVSGSAAKISRVDTRKRNKDVIYAHSNAGCSVLEVFKSGKVVIKFYDINSPNYQTPLFSKDLRPVIKLPERVFTDTVGPLAETVTVAANPNLRGSRFSRFLIGENYRKEWTTPVTMPVLNLGTELGGLVPEKMGGGKQTKSLRVQDHIGKEWVLRSIEKFPDAAIPPDLRQTFAKDVVRQGISASYPYASLSTGILEKAAGIPVIRRRLVYVPDDPRLLRFRAGFSNLPAILEEREPEGVEKTENTDDVVLKLAKDNDHFIDQRSVLRARLLDNFIMDFDRHEDQWRWAVLDTGKGKLYAAIPRDRDQAFFISQGITPKIAAKPWFIPEIQGFRAKARNIKTFNKPARNFDRFFMTELTKENWEVLTDSFLLAMTDEVIERALRQQPKEIHGFAMNTIIETLKKRRLHLRKEMMEYYRFLSRIVSITGSNQREQFTITKNSDGTVRVLSNKIEKEGNVAYKLYERVFDPEVTKEIRIYGLGDEDRYVIEGGRSPIKIRIIGGQGNDEFINNGTGGKVIVYDAIYEKNTVSGNPGLVNKISNDPQVNRFNRFDFKYNYINPGTSFAYNIDDGFFMGLQLEVVKQGFRKDPYKMRQFISGNRAFNTGALRFRYEGDWIGAFKHHDLVARGDIRAPVNVTNFFGLGNNTVFAGAEKERQRFYRARYDFVDLSLLMRRQLQSWMRVNYGLGYQYFQVERESNRDQFVGMAPQNGLDPATLYKPKAFLGGHFKMDINSKNNRVMPTRGFVMDLNLRPMVGLNSFSHNLVRADVDMRVYASLFSFPRIVLASRLGWGKNYGKFEFPQAYYLSGVDNLRGYRRDRFAGRSRLYNNTEIRFKVAEFSTYLFPGSFGFLVFNDVGRVWMDGEKSRDWKVGNGVGIWVAPIKRFVLAAHLARSKEEKALPYVSFGFQF